MHITHKKIMKGIKVGMCIINLWILAKTLHFTYQLFLRMLALFTNAITNKQFSFKLFFSHIMSTFLENS